MENSIQIFNPEFGTVRTLEEGGKRAYLRERHSERTSNQKGCTNYEKR